MTELADTKDGNRYAYAANSPLEAPLVRIGLLYFGGGMLWLIACLLIGLIGSWRDAIYTSTGGVVLVVIGVTILVITTLRRRSTHGNKSGEDGRTLRSS